MQSGLNPRPPNRLCPAQAGLVPKAMCCGFPNACKCILFFALFCFLGAANARAEDLPKEFDLRDVQGHSYLSPIKNQAPWQTCYSFAATAAGESTYNRAMDLYDQDAVSLSEAFIIWSLGPKYSGFPNAPYGDGSSYAYDELQALVDYGTVKESVFPYRPDFTEYAEDEEDHLLDYHWDAPRIKFAGWHRLPVNDIATMKKAIRRFGALHSGVYSDTVEFQTYDGGVFSNQDTAPDNYLEYYSKTDHAIALVGWDEDRQAWILRNSWGEGWGQDGYMYIDYRSAKVGIQAAYLHYEPWSGEDFSINNTSDITAGLDHSGYQPVARGIYEWGGNQASMINQASIEAVADVDAGNPYVHGMYLWAGSSSRIENTGTILAGAASSNGQATAYGICLQGKKAINSGSIAVEAESGSNRRATAYGIRHFGFDDTAVLENTGMVNSASHAENGWAYGLFGSNLSSVFNTGTVSAEGQGAALGIAAGSRAHIENRGRVDSLAALHGQAYGIYSYKGSISNSGDVQASSSNGQAYGIYIENGSMFNSGNINASSAAGDVYGVFAYETDFENTGNIISESDSGNACAVALQKSRFINLSDGTLLASNQSGKAKALYLEHSLGINNGTITGATLLQNSSLLRGAGEFNGNVTNKGSRLAPGNSMGAMTINGDYIQDENGALEIEFDDSGSDRLIVGGTASLDGALVIIPQGYVAGSDHEILSTSQVNGGFGQIVSPAVFDVELCNSGADLNMNVARNSYESLIGHADQKDMAAALDRIRPTASGDMADVLNGIDKMQLSGLQGSMQDMYPGMHAAAGYSALQTVQEPAGIINEHWTSLLARGKSPRLLNKYRAKSVKESPRLSSWGTFTGGKSRSNTEQTVPGIKEDRSGATLGVDYKLGEHITLGAAGAFAQRRLDERGGDGSAQIDSYSGHLYSLWTQDRNKSGWRLSTVLGAGRVRFDATRALDFSKRKADSEHSGYAYSLAAKAGYEHLSGKWFLSPSLDLRYAKIHEQSYSESGAESLDLELGSRDSHSLQSGLGIDVSRLCTLKGIELVPKLKIKWLHEFLPEAEDLQASFRGSPYEFDAPGRDLPQNMAAAEASLAVSFSDSVRAAAGYECRFAEGNQQTVHTFNAELRIMF